MIRVYIACAILAGCGAAPDPRTVDTIIHVAAPVASAICHAAGGDPDACDALGDMACHAGAEKHYDCQPAPDR